MWDGVRWDDEGGEGMVGCRRVVWDRVADGIRAHPARSCHRIRAPPLLRAAAPILNDEHAIVGITV